MEGLNLRYKDKKNVLELLVTIKEALVFYKENRNKSMLGECLGAFDYISQMTNQNKKVSKLIEKIEGTIESEIKNLNINLSRKTIENILNEIDELMDVITVEMNAKIQVLFLPYKAAMWDSMESIWESVKNDEQCDCEVVSLTYCELDDKKQVKNVKNEFDKFPEEVKIKPSEKFNIQAYDPDIIYIHNPYDSFNKITMIDPLYFSEELKKLDAILVYVPYFVAGSYKSINSHEQLIAHLPGVKNSDKIVVQSKVHKDIFLQNGFEENKILALGSPKFDAVLNKRKMSIPDELDLKIKNRKVFLLSTGIGSILVDNQWFEKIKDTINPFLKNEDIFLIWRVHPLMKQTMETMKKDMWDDFRELEAEIIKRENIIMDYSDDAYLSFAAADALISDHSSIMFQFMATEKPVMGIFSPKYLDETRYYAVDYSGNYFLNDDFKVEDFVKLVIEDNDFKKVERLDRLRASIVNLDGSCGKKIHENIKVQFLEAK